MSSQDQNFKKAMKEYTSVISNVLNNICKPKIDQSNVKPYFVESEQVSAYADLAPCTTRIDASKHEYNKVRVKTQIYADPYAYNQKQNGEGAIDPKKTYTRLNLTSNWNLSLAKLPKPSDLAKAAGWINGQPNYNIPCKITYYAGGDEAKWIASEIECFDQIRIDTADPNKIEKIINDTIEKRVAALSHFEYIKGKEDSQIFRPFENAIEDPSDSHYFFLNGERYRKGSLN